MQSFKKSAMKAVFALVAFGGLFGVVSLAAPSTVQADPYHHHHHYHAPRYVPQYYAPQYRVPHYHAPSIHVDRTYHVDSYHWTPYRGLHTHGHYDYTPHSTPGHLHW